MTHAWRLTFADHGGNFTLESRVACQGVFND